MTSIYPYILNNINYANTGQNLFDPNKSNDSFYSLNDEQFLFGSSLTQEEVKKINNARLAIIWYYYSTVIHSKKK